MRDDARLPRSGAGQNQERTFGVLYGFALSRIEGGQQIQNFLFYRDALCEIAGLIDIASSSNRDVVGQQLQRKGQDDRHQQR